MAIKKQMSLQSMKLSGVILVFLSYSFLKRAKAENSRRMEEGTIFSAYG